MTKRTNCAYLFAILFLCRLFVSFTYIGSHISTATTGDNITSLFVLLVLFLLSLLPSVYYIHAAGGRGTITMARGLSPVLAKGLTIIYMAAYLLTGFATGLRFELFAGTVMLPNTSPFWFAGLVFLIGIYGASRGFPTLCRSAVLILGLVLTAIALIVFSLGEQFETANITPLFYDGLEKPLNIALYSLSVTMELSAVPLLLDKLQGNVTKHLFLWALALFAIIALLVGFSTGVLGVFGNSQLFPIFSMTVLADFGIFQRIDALQNGVWTLCVLLKLCFLFWLIGECAAQGFQEKARRFVVPISAAGLLAAVLFSSRYMKDIMPVFNTPLFLTVFLLLSVAVPLLLPLGEFLRARQSRQAISRTNQTAMGKEGEKR